MQENSSIEKVLEERGNNYGDFKDQGALAIKLKEAMRTNAGFCNMSDAQKEALDMIQHKIARIINGNPNYEDSWVDIQGYAELGRKECIPSGKEFK